MDRSGGVSQRCTDAEMILWRLRGYADPEGESSGGEMACSIEKSEDGYRLLVEHDGEIQLHESHASIDTARRQGPDPSKRSF